MPRNRYLVSQALRAAYEVDLSVVPRPLAFWPPAEPELADRVSASVGLHEGLGAPLDPGPLGGPENGSQRSARHVLSIKRTTGVKRDCSCTRARHSHGTWKAYQNDKCSCDSCRAAWSKYIKQWKHRQSKGETLIPAAPHILKLRCLAALGYSQRMLGKEMDGLARETVRQLFNAQHILPRTAALIDKTYRRLCMQVPPATTRESRQARARARKLGWLPPLAYDEEWHPVEEEPPAPARRGPKTDWKDELEFLVSCGESEEQALKQLGKQRREAA